MERDLLVRWLLRLEGVAAFASQATHLGRIGRKRDTATR